MTANMPGSGDREELEQASSGTGPSKPPAEEMGSDAAGHTEDKTAMDQPAAETTEDAASVPAEATTPMPAEDAAPAAETPVTETAAVDADDDEDTVAATDEDADEDEGDAASSSTVAVGANAPRLRRGDLIEGTITLTSPTEVRVDVGEASEGVIPSRELERINKDMLNALKVGEKIWVYVINPNDHNGNVLLSVNRALEELDWQEAETYRAEQKVYQSTIAGYNKGGLIVRFGRLRGFVPQSQIGADRRGAIEGDTPQDRWSDMVNEPVAVKVMEVDRSRNRLILSERAAAREFREQRKENLINELHVGEVRTGRVVSLVDFGAFVDVGGAEGLVHLTEISWEHINHPRDRLKIGQEVTVEVISVDPNRKRIGLSMKRQEADPWDNIAINYSVGQLVQGTVTKLTKFGAFAQLADAPEIEGLIHISELSEQRVNHPREVVDEGDTLTLRVVKIDIENRRLGLSLKRVNSAEYLDLDWD